MSHSAFPGCVGLARIDITPPVGIFCRNWAAAVHDPARGVHRPLVLTAIAIREAAGGHPLVLFDSDLGWWANISFERRLRGRVSAALGLVDNWLLSCGTHTHSAPPLASIANSACHPTTLAWDNDLVSPDMVGELRSTIEREGAGLGLFLQGASK
jgi:hypothetical protein